jgi:RNA polymerase sigma factor (TIGR02999 family)
MRRVLVDHAKSRSRLKRNPGIRGTLSAEELGEVSPSIDVDVIALDDALENLLQLEPRLAQVIELYYFGGMTYDEIAAATGTSSATVHRDIRLSRAWLLNEIGGSRST